MPDSPPFAELHCRSNFSFLEAASHPDELVTRAAQLGYRALAITDRESVAGVVRGWAPAKELGLQYIVGTEVHPIDAPPLVIWPTDRLAYGRMCRVLSRGRLRAEKGRCEIRFDDLVEMNEGLLVGALVTRPAWRDAEDLSRQQKTRDRVRTGPFLRERLRDVFGDRAYLLCHLHGGVDDRTTIEAMRALSIANDIPLVATGSVAYHVTNRMLLHDAMTAIRNGTTIDNVHSMRHANSQYQLRTREELARLFHEVPGALSRTIEIADRCEFKLDELRYEYPEEIAPPGMTLIEHLRRLTWEGANQRWPDGIPEKVLKQIRHEIKLIEELHYEAYFLTVWDMVRFARSRGILCQGRGSAANSAVCYCLGVTSVDPGRGDMLFERFISRERGEAPDIDIDFEHQRREEVLQYIYQKYGRDRAGMTAVVTTYRTRSAVREIGKALGVSEDIVDTIAKVGDDGGDLPSRCELAGLDPKSELGRRFVYLVQTLVGFPRHLSQHTGGMVITSGPLCQLCPIENASMPDRTVIQWNKDDLDELGILKIDVLALGMLSAIQRCFDLVAKNYGRQLSLSSIPPDDQATYDMICRADTIGVFQIESRAQMSMLPRLRPRCYYDLVIEVSIVRPGPIQGNMVHPYLKARDDPNSVVYPNDAVRSVLEKTLGVPIFQEQAMRLAVVAAGFTPGEADQLRRAMAAWRRPGVIDKFREKLLVGMHERGLTGEFADQVFNQIRGFGEYGFPESHAASFALLVYASCYLKCHYPDAFCAAILNSQPMGFYQPAQLIDCARKHGVNVRPPDVNHSDFEAKLESCEDSKCHAIRLGLRSIRGLPELSSQNIVKARRIGGPFTSLDDLKRRSSITQSVLSTLADSDALHSIAGDRRAAIWQALDFEDESERPLFETVDDDDLTPASLRAMSLEEEVYEDYHMNGMSLKAHPISFLRDELDERGCVHAADLPSLRNGRHVRVAGLVLLRQRPGTAKGINFITLEDETGPMNLVIFPPTWKRFFRVARTSNTWIVDGKLESKDGVIHVIVGRIEDFSERTSSLTTKSRDFH
ncbi:MAG: error-prone DNA polymerase [Planctomycetota bacterium]